MVPAKEKGAVTAFNPLKSDGASRTPSWWPDPARQKEDYRCVSQRKIFSPSRSLAKQSIEARPPDSHSSRIKPHGAKPEFNQKVDFP